MSAIADPSKIGISANVSTNIAITIAEIKSMIRSTKTTAIPEPMGMSSLSSNSTGRIISPIRSGKMLMKKKDMQRM